jgi:hypothetical protein
MSFISTHIFFKAKNNQLLTFPNINRSFRVFALPDMAKTKILRDEMKTAETTALVVPVARNYVCLTPNADGISANKDLFKNSIQYRKTM